MRQSASATASPDDGDRQSREAHPRRRADREVTSTSTLPSAPPDRCTGPSISDVAAGGRRSRKERDEDPLRRLVDRVVLEVGAGHRADARGQVEPRADAEEAEHVDERRERRRRAARRCGGRGARCPASCIARTPDVDEAAQLGVEVEQPHLAIGAMRRNVDDVGELEVEHRPEHAAQQRAHRQEAEEPALAPERSRTGRKAWWAAATALACASACRRDGATARTGRASRQASPAAPADDGQQRRDAEGVVR